MINETVVKQKAKDYAESYDFESIIDGDTLIKEIVKISFERGYKQALRDAWGDAAKGFLT